MIKMMGVATWTHICAMRGMSFQCVCEHQVCCASFVGIGRKVTKTHGRLRLPRVSWNLPRYTWHDWAPNAAGGIELYVFETDTAGG